MVKFVELEHKFCFDTAADLNALRTSIEACQPETSYSIEVNERYFLVQGLNDFIIRHKVDGEKQSLTLKSFALGADSEQRLEIDIPLSQESGDQLDAIERFLSAFGDFNEYKLTKELEVFTFPEAEIILYRAFSSDREVFVLEVESKKENRDSALCHIKNFETQLELLTKQREKRCLFELLFTSNETVAPRIHKNKR
ncbi:hypothetical protein [Legionella sp. CNM-4043-24]|uniref:hypothetical protein n=1 Tax=Legionella sp. CNM-4043-24 TaxID=3421646 RepID=UPI00403A7CAE